MNELYMRSILIFLIYLILVACAPPHEAPATQTPSPPATIASSLEPTLTSNPTINSIETIIRDMQPPHEAKPHGVPADYNWSAGPRIGMGNNPGEFTAIIPWGQVYECAQGNPAANTRIHLRNIALYILSKSTGAWKEVQRSAAVTGAAYVEDFKNDTHHSADERSEPDGGLSVTAGDGYNYHFFTWRDTIDPEDIAGVFSTIQARLILADPNGADDRDQGCYVLSMGADYWRDLKVGWNAQFTNNGDVAIGKFKRVTTEWQAFNMTSLSAEDIHRNPPPVE